MNKHVLISAAVAALMVGGQAHAAQGTAKAKMKVVTAIAVNQVSDLIFTEASAGAPAETVAADTAENAQNASFKVTGEANRAITVTLPQNGTVVMKTGAGGADSEIAVNDFTSNNPTTIGGAGDTDLFVGATRAQLSANQVAGDYETDFTVDVVYQ